MSAHPKFTDIEIKSTNRKKMRKRFSLKRKQHSLKCREKVQKKIPSQGEFSKWRTPIWGKKNFRE